MPPNPKPLTFRAPIYKLWLLRCVNVPQKISAALGGGRGRIPVRGWIEDLAIQSTLTPRGGGQHRLAVNSSVWRPLKLGEGDTVTVTLVRDEAPEKFPVPPEFAAALAEDYDAQRAYAELTPAMRRQVVQYVAAVKRPDAREKRIAALLERLRNRTLHGAKKKQKG